jgi:hypothetical protein
MVMSSGEKTPKWHEFVVYVAIDDDPAEFRDGLAAKIGMSGQKAMVLHKGELAEFFAKKFDKILDKIHETFNED